MQDQSFDGVDISVNYEDEFTENEEDDMATTDSGSDSQTGDRDDDVVQDVNPPGILPVNEEGIIDEQKALDNPYFRKVVDRMLEDKLKQVGLQTAQAAVNKSKETETQKGKNTGRSRLINVDIAEI